MDTRDFTVENNVYKGPVVNYTDIYKSIGHMIWDKLNSHGNKIAHLDARTEETVTYEELQVKTVKCALWLKHQGIGRDDVVSICSNNHFNSIVPCLSATYVAAIFNTMNEDMDLPTALHCIKLIRPKAIFCTAKPLDVIRKALKETNYNIKVIVFDDHSDAFSFSNILNGYSDAEVANFRYVKAEENSLKKTACILHSSGTTGMPKGVEISNYTMLVLAFEDAMDMNNEVSLWFSSLYWMSGVFLNLEAIAQGSTVLLYPVFDEQMTCVLIEKYKVHTIFLSTSMMSRFLKAGYIKNYSLSSLKVILVGGAILKPSVQEDLKNLLPHVDILQAYGMTEVGFVTLQNSKHKSGSSGTVVNNVQLKIVDPDTGKILGPNQSGEVCVKSANIMNGYYNNPEETKKTIDEDGWLHTGDIGYVDEDGELFIWDRIKELMKYRGFQISPGEIEAVLSTHPAVCEVAVVGVPHEIDNDRPLAFVTKKSGAKVTEQELIDHVANNMMDQYKLRAGVIFLESFSYTGSGKILKKDLKAMAKNLAVD
ncbi:4-coumarate--CoA ligase 1-like [Pseudomyrmex gracilis]|uniref:4-coumarate--CoA ligase 1-like n=1 Tax=Pseudomyrmex gracilis TaxID=219809 RepID=UPI000995AB0E|nr:4-coumarate--CoA ligase 1-like [Pseudomyrmex gracilis]XP_020290447.1 4-coumarate--CoA ligase 1-like [Pseudomyrmex gracilis]XP_020290448.1 4-coumarate--CoA ligase 1-like [Pseudomyrmex gracilis]XP_020290449.1 4-coumarate--CoA ligase 1-like [Pseudomyrmex gracilis]